VNGTDDERPEPIVPGDMHIFGKPARVLLELDMGKERKLIVPIGDLSKWQADTLSNPVYGELTIFIRNEFHTRILSAQRAVRKDFP
jgi:hypothetical protein